MMQYSRHGHGVNRKTRSRSARRAARVRARRRTLGLENLEPRIVLSFCANFPNTVANELWGLQTTMDSTLGTISDLPMIGSAGELANLEKMQFLKHAGDAIQGMGPVGDLSELENTLEQILAANDVVVTQLSPGSQNYFQVDIVLSDPLVSETVSGIALDTGLPGLPVSVDVGGDMDFEIAYEYMISFTYECDHENENGVDTFTFTDNNLPERPYELELSLDVSLSNFSADAMVGFVQAKVTDNGSSIGLDLAVDSIRSSPEVTLGGFANLDLHVQAAADDFGYDGLFPAISSDLVMVWDFENNTPPTAMLDNVSVELGDFLGEVVEPIVDFVQPVLEPLQPVVDLLKEPVPVISQLSHLAGGNDITYLELAGAVGGELPEGYKELIELSVWAAHIIDIIGEFEKENGQLTLNLGHIDLNKLADGADLRSLSPALDPVNNPVLQSGFDYEAISNWQDIIDVEGIKQQIGDAPLLTQSLKDSLVDFVSKLATGFQYNFPMIENPVFAVASVLMGYETDLFHFSGEAHVDFEAPIFVSPAVLPFGLEVGVKGSLGIDAKIDAGYDTRGLREFLQTKKIESISEGHYLHESTFLDFGGSIEAYASAGAPFFEVGVTGGVFAGLHVDMNKLNTDDDGGKVRYTENDVLFNVRGDLHAYLDAWARIGVEIFGEFVGHTEEFNILKVPIWDFGADTVPNPFVRFGEHRLAGGLDETKQADPDDENVRAMDNVDGILRLNVGADAVHRNPGQGEIDETYVILPWEDGSILVSAFGCSQRFFGVSGIQADFGDGEDKVFVLEGVDVPVVFVGGSGTDELRTSGNANARLVGGTEDDKLAGGGGINTLFGGDGNDTLEGGEGPENFLIGGIGDDILMGGRNAKNTLEGGPGDDELFAGDVYDLMFAGEGNDFIDTGAGGGTVHCGEGDDRVTWEIGDATVTVYGQTPTPTPDNQDRGMDAVGIAGTSVKDTFTITDMANVIVGGETGHIVRVWHAESDSGVYLVQVEGVSIEGRRGADDYTVNDLHQTLIRDVGINLGDVLNPDQNAEDTILIEGSNADDQFAVLLEEATLRVEGPFGGITGFQSPKYTVHIANEADDATLNTFGGQDVVLAAGISGPTRIDTGDGDDLLGIAARVAPTTIALGHSAFFSPLMIEAGAGANAIWSSIDGAPAVMQETVWLTKGSLTAEKLIPLGAHFTATAGDFTGGVLLATGDADDTVYVSETFADTTTGIATGGGTDHLVFSSNPNGVGQLGTIVGLVVVDAGAGANYLRLDDRKAVNGNREVEVTNDAIVGFVGPDDATPFVYLASGGTFGEIRLDGSWDASVDETFRIVNPNGGLALYTHDGDEEIEVESTSYATQIRAGKGDDLVRVGSGGNTLDSILGPVAVLGQGGEDDLIIYDQDAVTGASYTIAPNTVMRSGAAEIGYTQVEDVTLRMTSHDDYVSCSKVPKNTQFALIDSGGNDFLYGPNTSTDYLLHGSDAGTLDGSMRFTAIENLWGGARADRFLFTDSSSLSGAISGGLGRDTLDYKAVTSDVRVNFPATTASFIHGVYDVEDAVGGFGNDLLVGGVLNNRLAGGPGNDILIGGPGKDLLNGDSGNDALIGGAGNDRLYGGSGRDFLVGGEDKDLLYGGDDDDILINGTTSHDTNVMAHRHDHGRLVANRLDVWAAGRTFALRQPGRRSPGTRQLVTEPATIRFQ